MINRRHLLLGLTCLPPIAVLAQTEKRRHVAIIRLGSQPPAGDIQVSGLNSAFRDLGYIEGRNLIVDSRFANGVLEELPTIINSAIRDGAEVLVAVGTTAALASRGVTNVIPIVAFANIDPIAGGLGESLRHPKDNVTGVLIAPEGSLSAKRLSLLQEVVPNAKHFALLAPSMEPSFDHQIRETQTAAEIAKIKLTVVPVKDRKYLDAFSEISRLGSSALIVGAHQFFVRDRRAIIDLANNYRLPAIYEWSYQVREGGLMSFGADLLDRYRMVAVYVDRIFKGARPSDLPYEQPSVLRLAINLGTARAIGIDFPAALLARAEEVID